MHIDSQHIFHQYGYFGMFFILLTEMIGIPFPAETSLTIAGIEWSQGVFAFVPLLLTAALGNMLGSTVAYFIGYYLGRPAILRYGRFVGITEGRLNKEGFKFEERRKFSILIGKFTADDRVLVPYILSINRMNFLVFSGFNALGTFIWAAFFIIEGRYLGLLWSHYHGLIAQYGVEIVVVLGTLIGVIWVRIRVRRSRMMAKAQDPSQQSVHRSL